MIGFFNEYLKEMGLNKKGTAISNSISHSMKESCLKNSSVMAYPSANVNQQTFGYNDVLQKKTNKKRYSK